MVSSVVVENLKKGKSQLQMRHQKMLDRHSQIFPPLSVLYEEVMVRSGTRSRAEAKSLKHNNYVWSTSTSTILKVTVARNRVQ